MPLPLKALAGACLLAVLGSASAQQQVVNLYSARHYSTDEALYDNFTKATGIAINRVDADDAGILARLKAEGSASPADVILLVDAARLYRGEVDGLFQPIRSSVLENAIPANLRAQPTADGGIAWFGLSTRARVIVYNKVKVQREDVDSYIASNEWRGKAGGYAIQGRAEAFIRFLSGSHSNVVGLPLFETAQLLRGIGWLRP